MKIRDLVRNQIRDLLPYEVQGPFEGKIKLDIMENPYDLPEAVKDEFLVELQGLGLNRYPDPMANGLREALSVNLGIDRGMITPGNGSDELILDLLLCFGKTKIVYPEPSFTMYEILARIVGVETTGIPLSKGFELDVESILRIGSGGVIFIAYPNNPTGNLFDREGIIKILKMDSLVVIDEAYYEFSKETFLPLLERYPNLAILRTFSKAFGLAGARIGYLVANREITEEILKVKLPYNLNAISQLLATIALKNRDLFRVKIDEIIGERDRVYKGLQDIQGVTPYPSKTNFILFKVDLEARRVFNSLCNEGILIRDLSNVVPLKDSLRVTIGRPEENSIFLECLRRIMEGDRL